jgi:hypothetical protein
MLLHFGGFFSRQRVRLSDRLAVAVCDFYIARVEDDDVAGALSTGPAALIEITDAFDPGGAKLRACRSLLFLGRKDIVLEMLPVEGASRRLPF